MGVARPIHPNIPYFPLQGKLAFRVGGPAGELDPLRGADLATAYWGQTPTSVLRSPWPGIISIQGTKRPNHLLRESALVWGWNGSRGWQPPLLGGWREVTGPREPREAAARGGRLFLVQPHHPPVRAAGTLEGGRRRSSGPLALRVSQGTLVVSPRAASRPPLSGSLEGSFL